MRKTVALSILFLLTMALSATAAAADDPGKLRHSGFYLAPGLAMASTPLFRQPSGNSEAAIPQKNSSVFLAGGWERSLRSILFGLRLAYWRNTMIISATRRWPIPPTPSMSSTATR